MIALIQGGLVVSAGHDAGGVGPRKLTLQIDPEFFQIDDQGRLTIRLSADDVADVLAVWEATPR